MLCVQRAISHVCVLCCHAEGQLLVEQVESVKKVAEFVSQLRRVGKGLGVYQFDKELGAAPPA